MSKLFDKALSTVSKDVSRYVDKSFEIANQIHYILSEKGITQRDLAKRLGKKESEVSKWLSGMHNLTMKTITKIEIALGEEIILVKKPLKEIEFKEDKKVSSYKKKTKTIVEIFDVMVERKVKKKFEKSKEYDHLRVV